MKIWIYRPDRESLDRKINRNYLYNGRNESYFDCLDANNEIKKIKDEQQDKRLKKMLKVKMEVPYE
jgi:hypothetical protein